MKDDNALIVIIMWSVLSLMIAKWLLYLFKYI